MMILMVFMAMILAMMIMAMMMMRFPSLHLCKKEVAPHRKTQSLYVDDKQVVDT